MSSRPFRAKAYIKEGCPFSLKFLIFMAEAKLLDEIEIVRLDPSDPDFEPTKARLGDGLGQPATFPTVEIEPGRYMSDSDALIAHYAERSGRRADTMPVLSFYIETVLPQVAELHQQHD